MTATSDPTPTPDARHYVVRWEIDMWAPDPTTAAELARDAVCAPATLATVWEVHDADTGQTDMVDLAERTVATITRPTDAGNDVGRTACPDCGSEDIDADECHACGTWVGELMAAWTTERVVDAIDYLLTAHDEPWLRNALRIAAELATGGVVTVADAAALLDLEPEE